MEEKYGIWCVVSGGVTGYREAWMKDIHKEIWLGTKEEAESKVKKIMDDRRGSFSVASFSYTPRLYY
jgi:hypothetical protein